MFLPLRWLFKIGGIFPEGSKYGDKYLACILVTTQLSYLCFTYYNLQTRGYNDISFGIHVANDLVDSLVGVMIVVKLYICRTSFIVLVKKCLVSDGSSSVGRFETIVFFVFSSLLVMRSVTRSISSGAVILHHDFLMGLLYVPCVAFNVLVYHLNCRYSNLNQQLIEVITEAKNVSLWRLKTELASVFQIHLYLRDLKSSLNSFFGLYNVITTSNHVVYLTVAMYYLITILCEPHSTLPLTDVFVMLCVIAAVSSLCDACYRCSEKAKETVRIAHSIVDRHTSAQIMEEIEDFSLTMFNNPVVFSAAGVFNLDRGLITKVTLATVTCLIIAIQLTKLEVDPTPSATNTTDSVLQANHGTTTLLG